MIVEDVAAEEEKPETPVREKHLANNFTKPALNVREM